MRRFLSVIFVAVIFLGSTGCAGWYSAWSPMTDAVNRPIARDMCPDMRIQTNADIRACYARRR